MGERNTSEGGSKSLLLVRGLSEATWRPVTDNETRRLAAVTKSSPRDRLNEAVWRRLRSRSRYLAVTVVLALAAFVAGQASLQIYQVKGASMEPGLQGGEHLVVNKLAYHLWEAPDRGDVIVFESPVAPGDELVKRIIGVPGDTVEILREEAAVYVNGSPIDESYVLGSTTCSHRCGPWHVPQGHYFVMGDNRANSNDSRQGWFVPEGDIAGKVLASW